MVTVATIVEIFTMPNLLCFSGTPNHKVLGPKQAATEFGTITTQQRMLFVG